MPHGQSATALGHVDPLHSDMIHQACDTGRLDRGGRPGAAAGRNAFLPATGPALASLRMLSFDRLIAEAQAAPFSGWDFSWLDARSRAEEPPWRYTAEVTARAGAATAMLDMGTGGGEVLAGIEPRPARTVATEAWPPNVPVAARRLRPLGIPVVQCGGAPDNMSEEGVRADPGRAGRLPFADGAFGLVINRHESFRGDEVCRVLAPGGAFITQQVDDHNNDDLYRLLGLAPPPEPETWLPLAVDQLTAAGLSTAGTAAGQAIRYFAASR